MEILEMKITTPKIRNFGSTNNRLNTTEEKISEFEDRIIKIMQAEVDRENKIEIKREQILND